MSRAQTIRLAFQLGGLALGAVLFLLLPFRGAIDFLFGVAAWLILGSVGERYFRKHATQEEIRADLEDRKNSPG
jgi:hypothetical protein